MMKILIFFVYFLFFKSFIVFASDPDDCDFFIKNDFSFTKSEFTIDEWGFDVLKVEDINCVLCPPVIDVNNMASVAGVNGLHNTQLIEINGENFLDYNNYDTFLKRVNKILEESNSINILFLEGEYLVDLNDADPDINKLKSLELEKSFDSPTPTKFHIEIEDIQVEDKSSNVRTLIGITYYYEIEKFSKYAKNEVEFMSCSFNEEGIDIISNKIFIPELYHIDEFSTVDSFNNLEDKRKIDEIIFFNSEDKVDIYVKEILLIDSRPITEFRKFPYDSLAVNITLSPANFISVDYKYEDWEIAESNALNAINLDEWKLSNILFEEMTIDKQTMIEAISNEDGYIKQEKDLFMNSIEIRPYIEFIYLDYILKRKHQFYSLKVIIPVFFIVLISFSTFWIRNNQIEAKLNLAIVSLLALIAYNFIVNNDIPKISDITVLDSFILISYLFTGFCTLFSVYSYYDYRRDKLTGDFNPIDVRLRYLAPLSYILAVLFFGILIFNKILF